MPSFTFRKASKAQARARIALIGPAGSGKTYSALAIATTLGTAAGSVAVIDTERGSASKYAGLFAFDVLELDSFDPRTYVAAIGAAEQAGYQVLVIDSLSHAWTGKGGALDLVDQAAKRAKTHSSFAAWRDVTPLHNQLVDAMLGCRCHLLVTLRAKTDYVQEQDRQGRTQIRKVGLAPVQRDGLEYEFDIVGDLDDHNTLTVTKTRCPELAGAVVHRPDAAFAEVVVAWLQDGVEPQESAPGAMSTSLAPGAAANDNDRSAGSGGGFSARALRDAQQHPQHPQQGSGVGDGDGEAAASAPEHQSDAGPPAAVRPASGDPDTPAPSPPSPPMREVLKALRISNTQAAQALAAGLEGFADPPITPREILDLRGDDLDVAAAFLREQHQQATAGAP